MSSKRLTCPLGTRPRLRPRLSVPASQSLRARQSLWWAKQSRFWDSLQDREADEISNTALVLD